MFSRPARFRTPPYRDDMMGRGVAAIGTTVAVSLGSPATGEGVGDAVGEGGGVGATDGVSLAIAVGDPDGDGTAVGKAVAISAEGFEHATSAAPSSEQSNTPTSRRRGIRSGATVQASDGQPSKARAGGQSKPCPAGSQKIVFQVATNGHFLRPTASNYVCRLDTGYL